MSQNKKLDSFACFKRAMMKGLHQASYLNFLTALTSIL